ncbi:MAG TPA: aromatic hydrocarbon degradation protein [Sulfurimonas sp. UBA12504]|nr:MAG: aromatic hydrocarbon degradation protein [Sulfurimonas sp. GWF2_37_8]DAB29157.1 MAG TPA: aromatic hydrocarbon degradation protein [Sulfurimonas sp. UBA12504]
MKKIALISLIASSVLLAGGYKIPETSLNAVALSAANIAHNKSADAAYYNPANMVFMADENAMEADLMYIKLDATNYQGTVSGTGPYDIDAKTENFLVPAIHYVSGKMNGGARFGLSVVSPGGLSKRWDEQPAKTSAEEFTLQTVEINPTVALPIGDKIGVAIGLRVVHSEGVVKSDGIADLTSKGLGIATILKRDLSGESVDFGYNIALAYKPMSELELGLTYRSKVDLTVEGDAKLDLTTTVVGARPSYSAKATVSVPLPATLSLAAAYTFPTKTTVEVVYERNYWSAYKELDFDYQGSIDPYVNAVFGAKVNKDWNDTNTFRLGVTQELDILTLMAGVVYDQTPVPDETLSFELPDSDSISVSIGGRYAINDKIDVGLSALYSMREKRDATNDSLDGEFSNSNVLLVSMGVGYKF